FSNPIIFNNPWNPGSNNPNEWNRNLALGETHTFSPRLLNDFRFGINRQVDLINQKFPIAGGCSARTVGLTGTYCPTPSNPRFSISGYSGLGGVSSGGEIWAHAMTVFQWSDTLTLITGRHILKFGGDYRRFRFNRIDQFPETGTFSFGQTFTRSPGVAGTGDGFADFL